MADKLNLRITMDFKNCSLSDSNPDPYSVDGEVILSITFPKVIPTVQSRNSVKERMTELIRKELSKIEWLIYGPIFLRLGWFLDSTDRQELDASGDLDNITKQLIDSLTGLEGIFVDDSQTKSILTEWITKNASVPNTLHLSIGFLSEETVRKDKAYFIQYANAMSFVIELDPNDQVELEQIKLFASAKKNLRNTSDIFSKVLNTDVRSMLVGSQKYFHMTRLGNIPNNRKFRL
jgi:Holliday junction resolvase RusA-like endonuclease